MADKHTTQEIGELTSLLHSRAFRSVLNEHKLNLQKEVNKFVKAQDIINAYAALKILEDIDKIVLLMTFKLEELQK